MLENIELLQGIHYFHNIISYKICLKIKKNLIENFLFKNISTEAIY